MYQYCQQQYAEKLIQKKKKNKNPDKIQKTEEEKLEAESCKIRYMNTYMILSNKL
jgi:hypothetical protein